MAFLTSTLVPLRTGAFQRASLSCRGGARVSALRSKRAARAAPTTAQPRMETDWTGPAPPSSVLGIGKEVSSTTFIGGSVVALAVGAFCVYKSNLISPLTPESVNAIYVLGSLLLPISWGMHVAGWIQKKNNK